MKPKYPEHWYCHHLEAKSTQYWSSGRCTCSTHLLKYKMLQKNSGGASQVFNLVDDPETFLQLMKHFGWEVKLCQEFKISDAHFRWSFISFKFVLNASGEGFISRTIINQHQDESISRSEKFHRFAMIQHVMKSRGMASKPWTHRCVMWARRWLCGRAGRPETRGLAVVYI